MNENEEAFNVPEPFQENDENEGVNNQANAEENEELGEEIVGNTTSERIMRKYFQNPNP